MKNFSFDFNEATTPAIQSQLVNGARTDLFKVKTISHGTNMNSKNTKSVYQMLKEQLMFR